MEDPRFLAVRKDPRFARFPKAKGKVELDARFGGVLSDPKFTRHAPVVDKRGRVAKPGRAREDLRRFYRLPAEEAAQEEEAAAAEAAEPEGEVEAVETEEEEEEEEEEAVPAAKRAPTRGRSIRGSVSVSSSSDEEEEAADDVDSGEEGVIAQFVAGEEAVPTTEATPRLALVDLEWDRMRAVDILAVLRSFLPPGGSVLRVSVYPSDFGLTRLAEEEVHGPRGAFPAAADGSDEEEEEGEVAAEALRRYERDRLRCFYAIADCDSAATAAALYAACDGLEFERSSTRLDLRYVPASQDFSGRVLRDAATAVPTEYAPAEFTTKALQQTRVTLTWDGDDPERKKRLRRKLTAEALRDEDVAAYLGSGSEDEGASGPGARDAEAARLRALLLGGAAQAAAAAAEETTAAPKGRGPRREGDMVVTFGGGLEERMAAKRRGTEEETLWAAQQRERKTKRAAARAAPEEPAAADLGFEDPFFAAAEPETRTAEERKRRRVAAAAATAPAAEDARRAAELELLLMDDARLRAGVAPLPADPTAPAPPPPRPGRKGALAAAKEAKRLAKAKRLGAGAPPLDTSDGRFAALFTRPEYALDPTDPRYAAVQDPGRIRAEAAARRTKGSSAPVAQSGEDIVARLQRKARG